MTAGMMLPRFDYEAPANVSEVTALLASAGDEARVLAGGTDLLVKMKHGAVSSRLVVSLRRIEGLDRVEPLDTGGVRIGSLMTMAQLAGEPRLTGAFAGLAEGAASVGGPIIRNRATVGGNVITARPCADTVPPLITLGARLRLQSADSTRTVDLDGFITGPGETAIRSDEILSAIEIPSQTPERAGSCYLKIIRRAAMEVTIVGCAASVTLDEDLRRVTRARVVLASVGPGPVRAHDAERVLDGQTPEPALVRAAAAAARDAARPIDDCRAPAWFRSEMVEVTARRALGVALERAGWGGQS